MPNQVFISYKNTDNGILTKDAVMAKELYEALEREGIDCFFATDSLRELGASDYSAAIAREIEVCPILVLVTTSIEHINSGWVYYEWHGFFNDLLDEIKKGKIFTYIDVIEPHDLPFDLRHVQSFEKKHCSIDDIVKHIRNALKEYSDEIITELNAKESSIYSKESKIVRENDQRTEREQEKELSIKSLNALPDLDNSSLEKQNLDDKDYLRKKDEAELQNTNQRESLPEKYPEKQSLDIIYDSRSISRDLSSIYAKTENKVLWDIIKKMLEEGKI